MKTSLAPIFAAAALSIVLPASGDEKTQEPASEGQRIFARHCAHCHAPGLGHPGTLQLGETRGEEFSVLEERGDLTADYVRDIVRRGLNAMPPFKGSVITDDDLAALATYLVESD